MPATENITVSGFSSGANIALNHFIAWSASVAGVGILGGSPYGCQLLNNSGAVCGTPSGTDALNSSWVRWSSTVFRPCVAFLAVVVKYLSDCSC